MFRSFLFFISFFLSESKKTTTFCLQIKHNLHQKFKTNSITKLNIGINSVRVNFFFFNNLNKDNLKRIEMKPLQIETLDESRNF